MKNTPIIKASHDDVIDHIVGMTEEQAIRTLKLNGVDLIRVMQKDCPYTMELREHRVNIFIENDKVVRATRG